MALPPDLERLLSLLDALRRFPSDGGDLLASHQLTTAQLDAWCTTWLQQCHGEPTLLQRLTDAVREARSAMHADLLDGSTEASPKVPTAATPTTSIPDGAFETAVGTSTGSPSLPFAGRSTTPRPADPAPRQRTGTIAHWAAAQPSEIRVPAPPPPRPIDAPSPPEIEAKPPARVPTVDREALERAALVGAAAASLEAARQARSDRPDGASSAKPMTPAPRSSGTTVDVLWFDASRIGALERDPLLTRGVSDELQDAWIDPIDDPKDHVHRNHKRVATILVDAPRRCAAEIGDLWLQANQSHPGRRVHICIEADLVMSFDAHHVLKQMLVVAELHASDKRLKDTIEECRRGATYPSLPSETADSLCDRLSQAFRASTRGLDADYLMTTARRALLLERRYLERPVLGARHLRATIVDGESSAVVYIPREARRRMLLAPRFRARLIAEVRARQDDREGIPLALHAVAIAASIDNAVLRSGRR